MPPSKCAHWLFGRGLSIACKLDWIVPVCWRGLPREEKVRRIKEALHQEMDRPHIDCSVVRDLLCILSRDTTQDWRHYFITTNWDYLLQRELLALNLKVPPEWLAESHVSHLNGTVERLPDNSNRSPFLLEEDPAQQRCWTVEANVAYNHMIWHQLFVVVGMSFECDTDKFLLTRLNCVEDDMPIGESTWLVLNPDDRALYESCERLQRALPRARVEPIKHTLQSWLSDQMPELVTHGVLAF